MAGDILIDDVSFFDMSELQIAKVEKKVLVKALKNCSFTPANDDLVGLLEYIEPDSEGSESEPCEMCGETVSWKIYKI